MYNALTKILFRIFAHGFYKAHAGIFILLFLITAGLGNPKDLINIHKALMLAFITRPGVMVVVFAVLILYFAKCWHYVSGQIFASRQHFFFYSSNSYTQKSQFISWLLLQANITFPILAYAGISIMLALSYHYFLSAFVILCYFFITLSISSLFYMRLINNLLDDNKQSFILKLTSRWNKPYFSLYVYHLFDKLKLKYLVTKSISYLIVTGVFLMFSDVSNDIRVAAIAVLAIAVSHTMVIFEERVFEENTLTFAKNLPYSKVKLFLSFMGLYALLLIPEAAWLFMRFSPMMAIYLLAFGLSIIMLFHCMLYPIGLDMEKYMGRVLGIFVALFWLVMFKLLWILVPALILLAYIIKPPNPLERDY